MATSHAAVGNLAEARKVLSAAEKGNEATSSVNQVELRQMAAEARTFIEACEQERRQTESGAKSPATWGVEQGALSVPLIEQRVPKAQRQPQVA